MRNIFIYILTSLLITISSCVFLKTRSIKFQTPKEISYLKSNWIYKTKENFKDISTYVFSSEFSSPVIYNDKVVVAFGSGKLLVLDKIKGKKIWEITLAHTIDAAPVIENNYIYLGDIDGNFYKIDLANGAIKWTYKIEASVDTKALVSHDNVYFVDSEDTLVSLDKNTGAFQWHYKNPDHSKSVTKGNSSPVIYENNLYIGFSNGFLASINTTNGEEIWARRVHSSFSFNDIDAEISVNGDFLYVPSFEGGIYKINKNQGSIVWQVNEAAGIRKPIILDNILYVASISNNIYAIDSLDGAIKWKYKHNQDAILSGLIIFKNIIIFGDKENDLSIITKQGEFINHYPVGSGVSGEITNENNFIYFISNFGNVYCLEIIS
jgi:outer membrane protein assembly factor BamB